MMRFIFSVVVLVLFITSCSDDCERENPTVLLVNNGQTKADVQVKTSGGNTENINNIMPGESSEKRSFSQGEIIFTVSIQGIQEPVEYTLIANYCNEYTITINDDNTVSATKRKLEKLKIL